MHRGNSLSKGAEADMSSVIVEKLFSSGTIGSQNTPMSLADLISYLIASQQN